MHHSLSPLIHNAALRALGLDWVYLAFEVAPGAAAGAIDAMRTLGFAGLNVTRPHKDDAARAVDRLSPTAATLGAVNTIVTTPDGLVGENTDGAGLLAALAADHAFDPAGRRCVVLGAGGAGRAVVLALAGAGAVDVGVVTRRREQGERGAGLAGAAGRVATAADAADAELVVNATPVGDGLPLGLDPVHLGAGQLIVDLLYEPRVTTLLATAEQRGAVVANGIGMLVHQAARSFELWTGERAPIAAMGDAVVAALGPPC